MNILIDNKKVRLGDFLLDSVQKWAKISVMSSYFTIFAYDKLKLLLDNVSEFRFLYLEPTFTKKKEQAKEFYIEKTDREKQLWWNEFEIKLRNELKQNMIAKECAQWIKAKAKFKSIKKSSLTDAKIIHIINNDQEWFVQWTFDFTTSGLWFSNSNKLEFNVYSDEKSSTDESLQLFDKIWNDEELTESVQEDVINYIQYIYKENSPEFIYYMTLYNLFKSHLDEISEDNIIKTRTNIKETLVWNKLYKFQRDWVLWIVNKLENYGGCILADSVWLGKTFEALAVIKYYELRNYRVLVLCPKKLRDNWLMYRQNDKRNILSADRFAYDVLNHTDLSRYKWYSWDINLEMINWWNYDLIVIDESHNFRNNDSRNNKITRYTRLMDDIIKNWVKTKVLMLSATPINNRMNDLKNQVAFITEWNDFALQNVWIDNISLTLKKAQTIFNSWMNNAQGERNVDSLMLLFNMDYFKLLDTLTIARSRKHIEKYYKIEDIWKFPERLKPINIKSDIDSSNVFPTLSEINKKIKKLNLSVYALLEYVRLDKKSEYEKKYNVCVRWGQSVFKQSDREKSLINLMRVNILKRLESSVYSYNITLWKILSKIDYILNKIQTFEEKSINWEYSIDLEEDSIFSEEDEDLVWDKVKVSLDDMDLMRWKNDLNEDKLLLQELINQAKNVKPENDLKLQKLKDIIYNKVQNPINNYNKKIVVFSSFSDTCNYLYEKISPLLKTQFNIESAMITWSWYNKVTTNLIANEFNSVLIHFSPISKEKSKIYPNQPLEIDILFATDCISEWQNLQDCDYLINYDIHWNPVRIIQRFGRIDRIGSINDRIQLVNFWPNMELDEYIKLEARVRWRMILLDTSATWEDNIIEYDESKEMNDLYYRKQQLEQIQNNVVDMEELSWWISITDLTMNDFKMDLSEYMKTNKDELEKSQTWIYAITKLDWSNLEWVNPWVIYVLKQLSKSQVKPDETNPLSPYYIVYIENDWTVKYSFLQAKTTLDIFKKLSSWFDEVIYDLVNLFNKETNDWKNMKVYSNLLEQVIGSIVWEKKEKEINSIFSLWTSTLADTKIPWLEDFELISFLIIK